MLTAWTTSQPPNVYAIKSEDGLKFYDCDFGPWGYAALGGKYQMIGVWIGPLVCEQQKHRPASASAQSD